MELLEREGFLGSLTEYAAEAREGAGRLVLVSGEAGVGKTSLLEALQEQLTGVRWLWAACDGAFTPRPLGPLFDLAAQADGPLDDACRAGTDRHLLFRLTLDELSTTPTVLVVEDIHWADEATLDLLRFLGRRIRRAPVLILLTYRDDGLPSGHPLRTVLGELASQRATRRIALPALSLGAVEQLSVESGLRPDDVYRLTGGNPFYVTELLRGTSTILPRSANDVVLARVAALDPPARALLDALAVAGTACDVPTMTAMLDAGVDEVSASAQACIDTGVLVSEVDGLGFRHEIARLAVESAIPAHHRIELHRQLLLVLAAADAVDDARLAHHAEGAGDAAAVQRHALPAARQASELGAHRESAAQYERALRCGGQLLQAQRAEVYEQLAVQCSLIDSWDRALEARTLALTYWQQEGDPLRVGDATRLLARSLWRQCRGEEADAAAVSAVDQLERLPPSIELGWAYGTLAAFRMYSDDERSVALARRAQEIAAHHGDTALLSDALNTEGSALTNLARDGQATLRLALQVALAGGHEDATGRAYANLHAILSTPDHFAAAESVYVEGTRYLAERDLGTYLTCLHGGQAHVAEKLGRWSETERLALANLRREELSPINRLNPLIALGRVRLRQGSPEAAALIDEADRLATATAEDVWIDQVRTVQVEAAWLAGDRPRAQALAAKLLASMPAADPWPRGEAAVWAVRCGLADVVVTGAAAPYALELAGDWRGAAAAWAELSCPYEQALALLGSASDDDLREAVQLLDTLGAAATAAFARDRMRRAGHAAVPRGPRPATRADALGLTTREREVLDLMGQDLTNAEIGVALFISHKTVEHHVSSVLTKLGVSSRREAVQVAAAPQAATG